jgi:GT2 family glycosyltransferase
VGGWDESFFLFSEETDFALRAGDLGYALRYDPAAVTTHIGGVSMSTDPTMYALLASNRLRLYSKRHPARTSVYRWTVALHEAVRSLRGSPTHRAALSAVLSLDPAEPAGSRAETERVPAVPAQPGRPA